MELPFLGRLGNDPAEEDAVRVALQEATAARNMALIVNSAHDGRSVNADSYVPYVSKSNGSFGGTVGEVACPDLTGESPLLTSTSHARGPRDGQHTETFGESSVPLVAPRPPPRVSYTNAREATRGALPLPPPSSSCEVIEPPTPLLYEKQRDALNETAFRTPPATFEKPITSSESRTRKSVPMESGNGFTTATDEIATFSFGALLDGQYQLEKVSIPQH